MASSQLVLAALDYAARGWPVFPVVPVGKKPLISNGCLGADTDPHQIAEWWSRWPHANIGIRTGDAFDVLDIDGPEGYASLVKHTGDEDLATHGPLSRTGKGEHWLYLPGNTANARDLGGLSKVDWRGTHGYIVAPPSRHPDGRDYAWGPDNGPDLAIPPTPEWLTPLLSPWALSDTDEPTVFIQHTNKYQPKKPPEILAFGLEQVPAIFDDIVAYAEEQGWQPRRRGSVYYISCVFHAGDNEPSMALYTHDNSFYCHACHAWGDTYNLRQRRKGGPRGQS